MHGLTIDDRAPRISRAAWSDDNARGLACAAVGAWTEAVDAFTAASTLIDTQADVESHQAMALVLNNLAQACFRADLVDEGIRYAQRACSLRSALFGEDAIAVARARADLAVMLGSVGRIDEGLHLIGRAITSIERGAGDEDLRLASVLENAARLAMAAGQPSTAEPYLLRLHALLDLHEMPIAPVEALLARVAEYRSRFRMAMDTVYVDAPTPAAAPAPVVVPSLNTMRIERQGTPVDVSAIVDVQATAAPVLDLDDDAPLRDAVELTDVLLRSTPTSVRAIVLDVVDMPMLDMPKLDEPTLDMVELEVPVGSSISPDDIFGNTALDLVDITLPPPAPIVPAPVMPREAPVARTATPIAPAAKPSVPVASPPQVRADVLGFQVEYGTPSESTPPDLTDVIVPPPTSSRVLTPVEQVSQAAVPIGMQSGFQADVPARTAVLREVTPRSGTPVVMPTPASSQRAVGSVGGKDSESAPKLTLHTPDELTQERRIRKPRFRWGRARGPRSPRGLLIAGALTSAITSAAAWFLLSGGR